MSLPSLARSAVLLAACVSGACAASSHSPAAVRVAQQLMTFLTTVPSSEDLTIDVVGKQFGVTLNADSERSVYRSGDLGSGWNYGLAVTPGNRTMKRGFEFWFYNPTPRADPTPICALNLNALRQHLVAHGFVERVVVSERGGSDGSDFSKGDLVLTVTARDLVAARNGEECITRLQTTDGR